MASPAASSDEGEIRDGDVNKANTTLPQFNGTSVDRPDRPRNTQASKSPEYEYRSRDRRSRERSRSPYYDRQSRGAKRPREDEYPDRSRDPRRFKVHYEDAPQDYHRRPRVSYEDIDQGPAGATELHYDDHNRYSDKRARTRSRSPYRSDRNSERAGRTEPFRDGRRNGYGDSRGMNSNGPSDIRGRESKDQSVSKGRSKPLPAEPSRHDAKTTKGSLHSSNRDDTENHQDKVETAVEEPEPEPIDEAALIEQRRKRREAIKAKYKASSTPLLVQALQAGPSITSTPGQSVDSNRTSVDPGSPITSAPGTPADFTDPNSPTAFAITNDQDLANTNGDAIVGDEDGPSAADYDPTNDMREDKHRDDHRHEDVSAAAYDETRPTIDQDVLLPSLEVEVPTKKKDEFDMFAEEDDDDMFAEEEPKNASTTTAMEHTAVAVPIPEAKELDIGMLDNWDDPEGYYKIILGELLNGRYHVQANLGQGMFSGVVRAMDVKSKRLVAIKLIRNNETMRKAGYKEIDILQKLNEADLEDKKHMIRLERHFEHKGHLCMVFEHLSINLREVLKKFGRDVGINLRAVRAYAQQMFLGLSLMRKCNVLHADLKPDNILVNEGRNMLKICDLGSASDASENEITPYLVSRFYRAPEIILGMQYDFAIDVWSVGCTLYEMYTGKILFTGRTNNQMLRSIMDCRGKFTVKMLKRAQFAHIHFDEMANFRSVEQDKLTGKDIVKTLTFAKPSRDLRTRLMSASKGLTETETKELALFVDLLDRCLALNPEKRCTPTEALKHPFLLRTAGR